MSVIELVRRNLVNYLSVKIALAIFGLAVSIPLISLWYWSFDSAYLATFGIGPEIYSRPVFSSKLMLTWFILGAITPGIWIIGSVAFALFVVLFGIHYRARRATTNAVSSEPMQSVKIENQPVRIIDIIDRSVTPASYLFLTPIFILLFLLFGMMFMSNKAEKLATKQVNAYVNEGICPDTFSHTTKGCYSISGEPDKNYFIIANSEKLIIYLSREEKEGEVVVFVIVKEKLSGRKIIRELKTVSRRDVDKKAN